MGWVRLHPYIQAVQTLSRPNRAYLRKDTTYVLDFVDTNTDEVPTVETTRQQGWWA